MSQTWGPHEVEQLDREESHKFLTGLLFAALFNLPLILLAVWEWHRGILR